MLFSVFYNRKFKIVYTFIKKKQYDFALILFHFENNCTYVTENVLKKCLHPSGIGHQAKPLVLQCINGVSSNLVKGRTKI